MSGETAGQPLVEHLRDLRKRLFNSVLILIIAMIGCYIFSDKLFEIIRAPILPYLPEQGLVFTSPLDKFVAHLKIAFASGIILSCPLWLYQIWAFISPGLYKEEKKYALLFLGAGSLLFILGVLFAYYFTLPLGLEFLMNFGGTTDKPMITIDHYLGFFTQICLMFGLAFELPLVITILGVIGVVSSKFLSEKRRFAIFFMSIFAALLTPPDVMSMSLMLVPLLILYEISIFIVRAFEKKRSKELEEI
ncbi:MAG: twin-arginine translocase subunit TatC [Bdellovibrionia bacterium]